MNLIKKVMVKSWEDDDHARPEVAGAIALEPSRIALRLFLAVVTALFFLLSAAWFMRKSMIDWRSTPLPDIHSTSCGRVIETL